MKSNLFVWSRKMEASMADKVTAWLVRCGEGSFSLCHRLDEPYCSGMRTEAKDGCSDKLWELGETLPDGLWFLWRIGVGVLTKGAGERDSCRGAHQQTRPQSMKPHQWDAKSLDILSEGWKGLFTRSQRTSGPWAPHICSGTCWQNSMKAREPGCWFIHS